MQRRLLERQLAGEADPNDPQQAQGWQTAPDGRPIDPETNRPMSRAEGMSFGGLVPLLFFLLAVVVGAFFFAASQFNTAPYNPTTFGPPDMDVEEAVRKVFSDSTATTGTLDYKLFALPLQILEMGKSEESPFERDLPSRIQNTQTTIAEGTFQRTTPAPLQPESASYVERIEYQRTDLFTSKVEPCTLVVARVPEGWRIVDFD